MRQERGVTAFLIIVLAAGCAGILVTMAVHWSRVTPLSVDFPEHRWVPDVRKLQRPPIAEPPRYRIAHGGVAWVS